jgi:hypothetical protein
MKNVVGVGAASDRVVQGDGSRAVAVLAALGCVLCAVGWFDWALVWVPLRFGNAEWEFGAISAAVDGLPLGTIGVSAVAAAAVMRGWWVPAMVIGIFAAVLVLVLLAAGVLYALDAPLAYRSIAEGARPTLLRAIARTAVSALAYVVFYGWLSWFTLRRSGVALKGGTE